MTKFEEMKHWSGYKGAYENYPHSYLNQTIGIEKDEKIKCETDLCL